MLQKKAKEEIIEMYVAVERERDVLKDKERKVEVILEDLWKVASGIFTLLINARTVIRLIKELWKVIKG